MYNALRELDIFNELERELATASVPLAVSGCMESQKAQLVSALCDGWMLYVCADEKQVAAAAEDLKSFNKSVWEYPARDLLFYSSDIHGNFVSNQRMDALKHLAEDEQGVLVTTIDALMEPMAQKKSLISRKLRIFEGMVIQNTALSAMLTELGYARVAEVETTGEYAVRGGIFDIYPVSSDEPYRIEFFDDEVDTIRSFDIASQRSVDRVAEIEVYPADSSTGSGCRQPQDFPADVADTARGLSASDSTSAQNAAVGSGTGSDSGSDLRLEAGTDIKAGRVSLYTYFEDNSLIVLDDPVRLKLKAELTETEFAESMERRLEKGLVDKDEEQLEIFSAAEIFEALSKQRALLIAGLDEELKDFGARKSWHFNTAATGNYSTSFELLISDILNYQKQGYRISVVTPSRTRTSRLAATLREYGVRAYCPDNPDDEWENRKVLKSAAAALESRTSQETAATAQTGNTIGVSDSSKLSTTAATAQTGNMIGTVESSDLSTTAAAGSSSEAKQQGAQIAGTQELLPGTVEVVCASLSQGFIYPDIKYVLMTESDMFGARNNKKRRKKKKFEGDKLISLNELSIGDYVVHEDHGIGVYKGLEHIVRENSGKDYIKIEYADGGNLYLPATKLDLIQKYADKTAKKPKLNKLNGIEWQKTRQRTARAVNDIARELIKLYAHRLNGNGYRYSPDTVWQKEFEELFPYDETEDQLSAIAAVKADMESGKIMDRLICGDVGFGKTEIALRAAFKAVQDGKQVIFLVPTTILAQQHFATFTERLSHYPVKVEMMSRFRTTEQNKKTVEKLKNGTVDIVIGTHRLLSRDVSYKDPGLLIIDEEQRFGVAHKEKIKQLKENLDVLSLTATPIPRTLHMSLSGIRDLSTLEEPPFDRVPIQTYVMEYNDEFVREAINRELSRNGQIFYVYNHVNGIIEKTDRLRALLPDARIEYAHGQMNERELEDIMSDFVSGEIDVLVSTTIVETGLDIPNANTLIVDGAERMGLSQLYQLRGRVGRSNRTSYAFLMYRKDKVLSEEAEKRLKAIREFTELGAGIRIAMRDLEIRGAGNVLGAEQHGQMQAVGYDLYCKLLSQAVRLMNGNADARGLDENWQIPDGSGSTGDAAGSGAVDGSDGQDGAAPITVNTSVDCDVDAYIPTEYIQEEYHRLDIYKRIAEISTEAEYSDMQDELIDRFGDMPQEVQTLLDIARLKEKAKRAYITELNIRSGSISMLMHPRADINTEAIPQLIAEERGKFKFLRGTRPSFTYKDAHAEYRGTEYMMTKAEEIIDKLTKH